MEIRRRHLYVIDFNPRVRTKPGKLRPAVVLADAGLDDWILCQVTSNPYGDPRAVRLTAASLGSGALRSESDARPAKLFTASRELMVAQVATLSPEAHEQLIDVVVTILRGTRTR